MPKDSPAPVRTGVSLLRFAASPDVARYLGLQKDVADDQLLASILLFMEQRLDVPREDIYLIANDLGLRLKAADHAIQALEPDPDLALPDEPADDQKKLQKLERELESIRRRQPELALYWAVGPGTTDSLTLCRW